MFGKESSLRIAGKNVGIWHMEPDLYEEEPNLLYSWGSSLRTTNDFQTVVGSIDSNGYQEGAGVDAKFNEIVSFLQVSKTQIIAVDRSNHCLRSIDRTTLTTSTLAGKCQERGYANGVGENARFFEPNDILLNKQNNETVIVVDCRTHSLREVNIHTTEVKLIIQDEGKLNRARSATFDMVDKNILYITSRFKVVKYSFAENKLEEISGDWQVGSYADGDLNSALFGYSVTGIIQLTSNLLAVADYWNADVRLIDLHLKEVTSLCQPRTNVSYIEGVGCQINNPHGLMYHNDTLYIGEASSIRTIPGKHKLL